VVSDFIRRAYVIIIVISISSSKVERQHSEEGGRLCKSSTSIAYSIEIHDSWVRVISPTSDLWPRLLPWEGEGPHFVSGSRRQQRENRCLVRSRDYAPSFGIFCESPSRKQGGPPHFATRSPWHDKGNLVKYRGEDALEKRDGVFPQRHVL
jgi:hypothetical protein